MSVLLYGPLQSGFMIEWRPGIPRHRQIAQAIRQRIESGEYADGHLITERSIKEEWGVATTTARKAVALLREWALIWTAPNMGSFVGQPETETENSGSDGASEDR